VETVVVLECAEQQTKYAVTTFMFMHQHHHLALEVAVTALVDGTLVTEPVK